MCSAHGDFISAASVAQNNITSDMNKINGRAISLLTSRHYLR